MNPENLQSACVAAVEAVTAVPLCREVYDALVDHLTEVFGDGYHTLPLAVRSSASGEHDVVFSPLTVHCVTKILYDSCVFLTIVRNQVQV